MMRGVKIKKVVFLFLLVTIISGQDIDAVTEKEENRIKVCVYCTCSEIPSEDGTHLVLNIQCSELDRIENLPDLDKIEWPDNPNGLKISATFEGLGLSTLSKLPPNSQVESLRFSNNAINAYWPDPFSDVPNLKKLSFSQNDLTEITPDLFTNIPSLEELDISYNKLASFNPIDFKSLRNLKRFILQSNLLKKIPLDALQPMTSLEDLDLSKNGIFDLLLQRSGYEGLKSIKRLNLNGNRIRSIMKDSFPENNSLELIDLSNNIIEIVEEEAFLTCNNLRELNLGQNNITFIFAMPPSLQIFILKQNTLHRWPTFPSGITYVDLSYNRLTDLYDERNVKFDNLEFLNIAGNQLKKLNIEKRLPKLYSLDLSYNQLEEIPQCLNTQILPNLEELRLDGNPIRNIYFKNILAVKSLYMNELNQLSAVENKAFSNVVGRSLDSGDTSCFSLFLSNCHALSDINEGAFDGTSVCMLDISSNNLTHLPEQLLPWATVSEGVNLQWNPWDCGCHLQWLLDELLPTMYERHSRMLAQLRCETPRALQGLRLVHWYNWTERVLCGDGPLRSGPHGTYLLEPSTEQGRSFLTNAGPLTILLGAGIILTLLIAIALTVYLIKGRRKYQVRQAALKRKRQGNSDARNSNGQQKEQYSALNKV